MPFCLFLVIYSRQQNFLCGFHPLHIILLSDLIQRRLTAFPHFQFQNNRRNPFLFRQKQIIAVALPALCLPFYTVIFPRIQITECNVSLLTFPWSDPPKSRTPVLRCQTLTGIRRNAAHPPGRNPLRLTLPAYALLTLLAQKPLHEISIRELCDTAGVGRTSFYRNFETKEDILTAHIRRLFHEWSGEWKENPELPPDQTIYNVFSHFEANCDFYSLLSERRLVYLLKDIILELCGFRPEQEVVAAYSSAYVAFFLYGWIEVWFRRGMKETAEELAGYLKKGAAT